MKTEFRTVKHALNAIAKKLGHDGKDARTVVDALDNIYDNCGGGSGGGADWDAKEGESGYISNKPFGTFVKTIGFGSQDCNIITTNNYGYVQTFFHLSEDNEAYGEFNEILLSKKDDAKFEFTFRDKTYVVNRNNGMWDGGAQDDIVYELVVDEESIRVSYAIPYPRDEQGEFVIGYEFEESFTAKLSSEIIKKIPYKYIEFDAE